jgi:hypothetical protein
LADRGNFWRATVFLDDGTLDRVALEVLEQGEPKIDWETHVCHQPMPWDEFVQSRPIGQAMDFRVYVEPSGGYAGAQETNGNDRTYFRLSARNSQEFLLGCEAPGSDATKTIEGLLKSGGPAKTSLILRLSFPYGAPTSRDVRIEKVVNDRWLYIDDPGPS